jgi:hypothetical protein
MLLNQTMQATFRDTTFILDDNPLLYVPQYIMPTTYHSPTSTHDALKCRRWKALLKLKPQQIELARAAIDLKLFSFLLDPILPQFKIDSYIITSLARESQHIDIIDTLIERNEGFSLKGALELEITDAKNAIGERIYRLIDRRVKDTQLNCKITGMLLGSLEVEECVTLCEDEKYLESLIMEAIGVLNHALGTTYTIDQ